MIVGCPSCQTKFKLDEDKFVTEIRLRCTKCRTIFKVVKKDQQSCVEASAPAPAPRRLRVFVAHESPAFCAAVQKVLANEPFDVRSFNDGLEAFCAIGEEKPDVVLLDVALPSMFGFEVCENVRNDPALAGVKTILIAAIYDKTRYKRTPASLYGADDYIEKHHIPDDLTAKIYRLTSGQQQEEPQSEAPKPEAPKSEARKPEVPQPEALKPEALKPEAPKPEAPKPEAPKPEAPKPEEEYRAEPVASTPQEQIEQQHIREELQQMEATETTTLSVTPAVDQSEAHMKARRFARIIVSDIALYNQAKVEQGVRDGKFYDLLADDINEGRSIYVQRIAEEIRSNTNYLDEALADLVTKKKKEFNL